MAIYDNLPVYKAAYDLLLDVYKDNINLPRSYRYTLGEKLQLGLTDLLVCIYKANSNEEQKEESLREARERLAEVKLYFRLLFDLAQMSQKRFIDYSEKNENLSKQLTAWHKSTIKKAKQDEASFFSDESVE